MIENSGNVVGRQKAIKRAAVYQRCCCGLLAVFLGILNGSAATYFAAGVDRASVSSAIALSSDGDTVMVPAGTATWSSGLTITKAINLIGAGTNQTIINVGISAYLIQWRPAHDLPCRLSGIRFSAPDNTYSYALCLQGKATQFRVDHCWWDNLSHALASNWPENAATGPVYGVIDHCTFRNCFISIFITDCEGANDQWAGGTFDGWASWQRPIQPGTTNCLCIEDNLFVWDSNIGSVCSSCQDNTEAQVYGQGGSRATIRKNVFNTADSGYIDGHCDQAWGGSGGSSAVVLYEVYSNVFRPNVIGSSGYAGASSNVRGGRHLWFGNTYSSTAFYPLTLEWYFPTNTTYILASHEVMDTYYWNNTWNGSSEQTTQIRPCLEALGCAGCSVANIIPNVNYFYHAPQPGQNFYPYVPLVYPHPLVSGISSTNPVTQVSVSRLAWEMAPNTGSSNQFVRLSNAGQGALTGTVSLSSTSSPSPWRIVGPTNYSLTTGSTNITVSYTPTSTADSYATLTFNDNGGGAAIGLAGSRPRTYVWPLGDSITQGHDVPGGYRLPLYQLLTNAGVNVAFVGNTNDNPAAGLPYPNHDGYGGYEIGDLAAGVPGWYANLPRVDYVLLMVGINDFRHNDDVQNATNRLENLIAQIATSAPAAKIIVADLNPWTNLQPTNAVMDMYYNPYIPGVVARQGALGRKVYLCDMRGKLSASDLEADNTHPTQLGYNKIATNWNNVISSLVNGSPVVTPPPNFRIIATGM